MVKNPNWQEVDQLAIYKRGRGIELLATEKQLLLAVRAGLDPGTSGFQVPRPNPLDHAASLLKGNFTLFHCSFTKTKTEEKKKTSYFTSAELF